MWKAFEEMETLGWIANKRPRMFAVQAAGCAPIIRAFEAGERTAAEFPNARTIASGLRVPKAIGDFLILNVLRESNGGAIAIDDGEMVRVGREVGADGAVAALILPKPAVVMPFAVVWVALALVEVGFGIIVRLRTLVNSARTLKFTPPSPIRNVLPTARFSCGIRANR